ncbi:hypothetical protein GCM10010428_04120 [Actinosynnema pretiosum subsp. pretiosum]
MLAAFQLGGLAVAVSGGTEVPRGTHPFLAKITTETAGCTGALVSPHWVITAASCFPGNASGTAPSTPHEVVVGDVDSGTGAGQASGIVKLVKHPDRDVALVKLEVPITGVSPVALATQPATAGESLQVTGFGRTATVWAPNRPRSAPFSVEAVSPNTLSLIGANSVDTCKGDAGGPVLRQSAGQASLVAVSSTSWQHGCLDVDESRQGSTGARVDGLADWAAEHTGESSGLRNDLSGWCLDQEYPQGPGGTATNKVGAWDCNSGPNQQWHWQWLSPDKARLVNTHSGWCLDQEYPQGPGGTATNKVGAWSCNGGANQEWRIAPTGSDKRVRLINALSGWCLDQEYPQGADKPGTRIVASWECNGGRNQQWLVF